MAIQTPGKQLFDLLVTKGYDPALLDSLGKPAPTPEEAELFSFDFTTESGNDYGTVVVMLAEDSDLQVYFGDNLGKGMEGDDKQAWFDFLYDLKRFATKNLMSFSPKNLNRLKYSMQGQAALKEGLFESWTGTRTQSWNGTATEARLMIKHKRALGENDARFRYVESLFIETAEGERYKLPFTKLSGGRAMVEHVRNGGRPYDSRGQHIVEMVNELNVLSRFRRANHGRIFEGDTEQLVTETNAYYQSLQGTLKGLSKSRGYTEYFESWNPNVITEEEAVVEGLKHLFVTQSLDTRIEDALPLLAKIQQQGQAMKEANIFEAWVNNLAEGTWATPDSPEKRQQLVELLSKEFPVGPDATNATEQLYDLLGDDELFDQLERLAEDYPDADCRQVVYDRMQMLSNIPDVKAALDELQVSPEATMNPADPTDAGAVADADQAQTNEEVKDPRTQTEDPEGTPQPAYPEYEDDLAQILKKAGVPGTPRPAPDYESNTMVKENVTLDEDGRTLAHIKNTFQRDIKDFLAGGELSKHLYDALFDYYQADMPYGTAKARDGDPYEWIGNRFSRDMGVTEDYAEEGIGGALIGGALGALAGGGIGSMVDAPLTGAAVGGVGGALAGDSATDEETDEGRDYPHPSTVRDNERVQPKYFGEEGTDEGALGALGGGVLGMAGTKSVKGSLAGAKLGSAIQDRFSKDAVKETTALQGQYGHSGKLAPVAENADFLDRLKELSGMMRSK